MYNTKSFGNDCYDREQIQVGKLSFTVIDKPDFTEYITKTYGGYEDFLRLKDKDKEKIFLRWKYGFTSDEANYAIEVTDRQLLALYKMQNINDIQEKGFRYAIQNKLSFEDRCIKIKKEIGLIKQDYTPKENENWQDK